MPLYSYKAVSSQGTHHSGYRFASSMDEVYKALKKEGLLLTRCQESREEGILARFSAKTSREIFRGIPRTLVIDFCYQMAQLDEAGVPLDNAIHDLALSMPHRGFRTLLHLIHQDLQAGIPLSEGIAKYPKVFGRVFEKLIHTAEQTGTFAPQFRHLETYLRQQEALKYQIRKSVRSPLILLGLMVILILIMVQLVIPNMATLLMSLGIKELPLSTRLLLHMTGLFIYIFLTVVTIAGLLIIGYFIPKTYYHLARFTLKFPLYQSLALNHFWHVFAVMIGAGIDLIPSLNQAVQAVQNPYLRDQLSIVVDRIAEGAPLSKAFQEIGEGTVGISPFMIRLLMVSERTGALRSIIPQAANHYQTQTFRQVETLISWLEPALILVMGALMLWVVLAVIVPFYGTLGELS